MPSGSNDFLGSIKKSKSDAKDEHIEKLEERILAEDRKREQESKLTRHRIDQCSKKIVAYGMWAVIIVAFVVLTFALIALGVHTTAPES